MIKYSDKQTIVAFNQDQIETYGGSSGIRDEELLDSAVDQPQTNFDGEYIHEKIFEIAAAYGFHICQDHPFYDGNKRTALIAIYTFLFYRLVADKKSLSAVVVDLGSGKFEKKELATYLKKPSTKDSGFCSSLA